jgi:signal transduction histidine kinase
MDNLLHWSRSRLNRITPKMSFFSLISLVRESLKMYETIIHYKEINLVVTIPDSIEVYADFDLLSCVIRNLVSNAIKYTPAGGTIKIGCTTGTHLITVIVSDTGTGIISKNISDILKKNSQFSKPGLMQEKGSGIGLKLCKEFVELNGGEIWVTNNEETGTRFMFTVLNSNANQSEEKKEKILKDF